MLTLLDRLDRRLDSCARMQVRPGRWNAYRKMGIAGYVFGVTVALALAVRAGDGPATWAVLAVVPGLVFLAAVKVVILVLGFERIVFYQQAIAVALATAIATMATGASFSHGLDLAVTGLAVFLVFGRVGCFRVGCCHGRPWRHGVAYGGSHVYAGLAERFLGHRLFPSQLVDATVAAVLAAIAIAVQLRGSGPGLAAMVFVSGYGCARFFVEWSRGDSARPYFAGLSEAQWTAVATTVGAAVWRPRPVPLAVAALLVALAGLALLARRRGWWPSLWLSSPRHLDELDALVRRGAQSGRLDPHETHGGLRVSVQQVPREHALFDWLVSAPGLRGAASPKMVARLARQLDPRWQVVDVFDARTPGLVHVLAQFRRERPSTVRTPARRRGASGRGSLPGSAEVSSGPAPSAGSPAVAAARRPG